MLVAQQPHLLKQRLDQGVDPGGSLVPIPRETAVLQVPVLEGKPVVYEETEKDGVPAEIPLWLPGGERCILALRSRGGVCPRRGRPAVQRGIRGHGGGTDQVCGVRRAPTRLDRIPAKIAVGVDDCK
jgi:hypothetical protein